MPDRERGPTLEEQARNLVLALRITSTRYADDHGSLRHVPDCPCCTATTLIVQALAAARAEDERVQKLEELLELVRWTRRHQRAYFTTRDKALLLVAKGVERNLDACIEELDQMPPPAARGASRP
jgi:hypothetical protein